MSDLQKKIEDLELRINVVESDLKLLKENKQVQKEYSVDLPIIKLPDDLIEKLSSAGEDIKFQILWYFSSKPIMSVKEFLDASMQKGFVLNHSWLPSVGGNFSTKFVKKGIFHEVKLKEKAKEKIWTMTDAGKFKVAKLIESLKN